MTKKFLSIAMQQNNPQENCFLNDEENENFKNFDLEEQALKQQQLDLKQSKIESINKEIEELKKQHQSALNQQNDKEINDLRVLIFEKQIDLIMIEINDYEVQNFITTIFWKIKTGIESVQIKLMKIFSIFKEITPVKQEITNDYNKINEFLSRINIYSFFIEQTIRKLLNFYDTLSLILLNITNFLNFHIDQARKENPNLQNNIYSAIYSLLENLKISLTMQNYQFKNLKLFDILKLLEKKFNNFANQIINQMDIVINEFQNYFKTDLNLFLTENQIQVFNLNKIPLFNLNNNEENLTLKFLVENLEKNSSIFKKFVENLENFSQFYEELVISNIPNFNYLSKINEKIKKNNIKMQTVNKNKLCENYMNLSLFLNFEELQSQLLLINTCLSNHLSSESYALFEIEILSKLAPFKKKEEEQKKIETEEQKVNPINLTFQEFQKSNWLKNLVPKKVNLFSKESNHQDNQQQMQQFNQQDNQQQMQQFNKQDNQQQIQQPIEQNPLFQAIRQNFNNNIAENPNNINQQGKKLDLILYFKQIGLFNQKKN